MSTDLSGIQEGDDFSGRLLQQMEASLCSRREIAMLRIRCLVQNSSVVESQSLPTTEAIEESHSLPIATGDGLAALFVPMFSYAVSRFLEATKLFFMAQKIPDGDFSPDCLTDFQWAFDHVCRLLRIHHEWIRLDPVLAEELARHGAHRVLIHLMQYSFSSSEHFPLNSMLERIEDCLQEVQDMAGTIAADSQPSFPILSIQPFSVADLQQRLPLKFDFAPRAAVPTHQQPNETDLGAPRNDLAILLHQITARQSAQVDVGFVLWPSAVVLSTLIVNNHFAPLDCQNEAPLSILELGAGCGLSGLVAARFYQRMRRDPPAVVLTDFNARVLENLRRNIDLNDLSHVCSVVDLDFYQQSGNSKSHWKSMDGALHDPVDIILAADVICQASDAVAVANTIHDVLKPGGTAYVVCADAKHRFGVDRLVSECQRVGLMVSTKIVICSDAEIVVDVFSTAIHLSLNDQVNLEQTTGYVHGMNLTLFMISKSLVYI